MSDTLWGWISYAVVGLGLNSYLVLGLTPIVLALLVLILFNQVGSGLGLAKLFRYDDGPPLARVFIGMGVGTVLWQALFAGYVFEEFATNSAADHAPWRERWVRSGGGLRSPADMHEILSYMLALSGVLLSMVAVVLLLRRLATRLSRRRFFNPALVPGTLPTAAVAEASRSDVQKHDSRTAVSSWRFTLGVGLGFAFMVGWSCFWLHLPATDGTARGIGRCAIDLAGYGEAAARNASNALILHPPDETLPPKPKPGPEAFRGYLEPYYPVFGLWFLNLGLILFVFGYQFAFWFLGRFGMYSPAVGIVMVMHAAIAIDLVLPVFVPYPWLLKGGFLGAILFVGGQRIYKYRLPGLERYYARPVPLNAPLPENPDLLVPCLPPASPTAAMPGNALGVWRPKDRAERKHPLVVVAASGGGSRAATWTTAVLGRLEAEFANAGITLPYHTRLVVGASGGMMGTTNYVTSLEPPDSPGEGVHEPRWPVYPADANEDSLVEWLHATGITGDWLTPVTHRLLYGDLPGVLMPGLLLADRGTVMEREWAGRFRGRPGEVFSNLRDDERAGWRPSLVYTPLMVEDGRQLVVGNLNMTQALRSMGPELTTADRLLSVSGLQLFDLFPEAASQFRVGTAARMSASFPFILPAATLPTDPPRRVVDAGYFDNYGIVIASAWLHAHREWVEHHYSGVLIVQIRDGLSAEARTRKKIHPAQADSVIWRGLHGITSPLSGVLAARSASLTFRCDKLLDLLEHDYGGPDRGFLKLASFEFDKDEDVSLNFRVSDEEVRMIADASLGIPASQIDALTKWWTERRDGS